MKLNRRICFETRSRLDQQLKQWQHLSGVPPPRKGWIKSIREALGMSSRQLASNLGKTNAGILAIEHREAQGKVTLATLEKVAQALRCQLVYALVPEASSLEDLVNIRAREAARRIVRATAHSMALEAQSVPDERARAQIDELAFELKQKMDPRIWRH